MKISNIWQTKYGEQEPPHGSRIWAWSIEASDVNDESEVLKFARQYLKDCKYDKETYFRISRANDKAYDESVAIYHEGYYEIEHLEEFLWGYMVEVEDID